MLRCLLTLLTIAGCAASGRPIASLDGGSSDDGAVIADGGGDRDTGRPGDAGRAEDATVGTDAAGPPCTSAEDCDDADDCTVDSCAATGCGHVALDADGDGIGPMALGCGLDCDDDDPAVPGDETCDDVDNDCDGSTDEDLTQGCYTGAGGCDASGCVGICAMGTSTCAAGVWGACTDEVLPATETCNGTDDDCDGVTDGLDRACYTGSAATRGVGVCTDGTESCAAGAWGSCVGEVLPDVETCNGADDDCDGMPDDGLFRACYTGPASTRSVGQCSDGTETCAAGSWGACTGEVLPGVEACDGIDNDCNGTSDDLSRSCYTGPAGTRSVGECRDGTETCSGGSWGTCIGQVVPTAETCNDKDDDCDGIIDDALSRVCYTGPASTRNVGACSDGVETCTGGAYGSCNGQILPQAETCNGQDDDCNGAADDGSGMQCVAGSGPRGCMTSCGTAGTQSCTGSCTLTTCVAAAETCGNFCDDDGNGLADDGCAPPNDLCTNAQPLLGSTGSRSDAFDFAGRDAPDSCAAGAEIWYAITLPARSILYVDSLGSSFDTKISVRSSCASAYLQCEDDDCGTLNEQLVRDLPAGTHYIAVHAFSTLTTTGTVNLRWQVLTAGNGSSTRVTANGTYAGTTSGTGVTDTPCAGGAGPENLYYFTLCPGVNRTVSANTCSGTAYDTTIYMRVGGDSEITCNDDSCALQSSITGPASGPAVYGIYADGYSGAGSYSLAISGL